MQMMWKPGTAKPTTSKAKADASSTNQSGGASGGGSSSAKAKLSSSTMGMRFMQRKQGNNDARNGTMKRDDKSNAFARNAVNAMSGRNGHREMNNNRHGGGTMSERNGVADAPGRKRDSAEISRDEQSSSPDSDDGVIILQLATVTDMYGTGSDVVGRRSFGGYRKSVRTTWEAALRRRTDDEARARNTKSHITDEELLERYEKYVRGDGKGGGRGALGKGRKKEKRKRDG